MAIGTLESEITRLATAGASADRDTARAAFAQLREALEILKLTILAERPRKRWRILIERAASPLLTEEARARVIADSVSNDELKWRARVREGEALRALARLDEAQQSFEDAIVVIRSLATNAATSAATRSQLDESATAWSGLARSRPAPIA